MFTAGDVSRIQIFRSRPNSAAMLGLILATTTIVGSAAGVLFAPDLWWFHLKKPAFAPPHWFVASVWLTSYVLTSIVGWRIWLKPTRSMLLFIWSVQLLMCWLWAPVIYALKLPEMALAMLAMAGAMLVLLIVFLRQSDRVSSLMLAAQLVWIGFVGFLNATILLMNQV